jgi:hypothetical protein
MIPSILSFLVGFGTKKTEFETADPADGTRMIKSDLETLRQDIEGFSDAIISAEPVSVLTLVR